MTIAIFASSAGWKAIGPRSNDRYAPLTGLPSRGSSSSTIPASAML